MTFLSIDRLEGKYAVCEDDTGAMHDILRNLVEASAKEGDVLVLKDGRYFVDALETQKRKQAAAALQKKLLGG